MKKLPKKIFVQLQDQGTQDEYLQAVVATSEIYEDGKVGIYELKEVKQRKTTHELL